MSWHSIARRRRTPGGDVDVERRFGARAMQLVAIGYPDTFTGPLAMEELERFGRDFLIRRDELAVIVRSDAGTFTTYTNAVISSGHPTWAMYWGQLFAVLFYIPMLGMEVGPSLAPLIDTVRRSGLDPLFEERIRSQMLPGTSTLFALVEKVSPDIMVSALDALGGTVLQSELSPDAPEMLQEVLHDGSYVA
jgi:uncharacterized membrane protein